MNTVTVVDARMGRGKTSAAIRYMNENRRDRRFLFVTPYLSEVERICVHCDFEEPDGELRTKSYSLKTKMRARRNVAMTHALFYLMDSEVLSLAKENGYSLIIDESINVVDKIPTSAKDFNIIQTLTSEDEIGRLTWNDSDYEGRFDDYKALADLGNLFRLDSALLSVFNPDIFNMFEEVIMMTYLFEGQTQKAYMDYFNIPYRVVGVKQDEHGHFYFSDEPDMPPPLELSELLNVVDKPKMNTQFRDRFALSKTWYTRRGVDDPDIRVLRRCLNTLFSSIVKTDASSRIWTCFKEDKGKITGPGGKYASSFLPMNIRATNEYRQATAVAYLVNRFCDPNIIKFFATRGIAIDNDQFALSEMIQFIWRSAIRDNKPITVYIPSERMRTLLFDWMRSVSQKGDSTIE